MVPPASASRDSSGLWTPGDLDLLAAIVARRQEQEGRVEGLRGRAELSMSAPDWAGSGSVESAILARRPGHLRMRAYVGPATAFDVVSRPDRFWVYLPRRHVVWTGPAQDLEKATGFPAVGSEVVAALLGEPFAPEDSIRLAAVDRDFVTLTWSSQGGRVEATYSRATLLPKSYRWWRGDRVAVELRYADYLTETVGAWPRELFLEWPPEHASLRIRFRELAFNPDWPADAFEYREAPGTMELRVGDDSSPSEP